VATSKSFVTNESELLVNGEAGADHAWSMEGTETATAQVSVQIDLGARPAAYIISWNAEIVWQGTPTVGSTCDFYYAGAPDGDATQIDGDVGASDADLGATVALPNCNYFGSVVVDTADTSKQVASGTFAYYGRYISLIGENNGGTTLNATDSNFVFKMTVRALQGQAT
jgi:hypothetical protein